MELSRQEQNILLGAFALGLGIFGYFYFTGTNKKGAIIQGMFKQALVEQAKAELAAWQNGKIKEGDAQTMDRLRAYWREGAGVKNWSDQKMISEAWSAALISYLMKKAGAGTDFKYAPSHSVYLREAIKNRKEANSNPFKGYKPEEKEAVLAVGDLVGRPRQAGVNYDTTNAYLSHSDLVIGIEGNNAITVGGNVGNSVSITKVPLTADGHIDNSKVKGNPYFVVVKNGKA